MAQRGWAIKPLEWVTAESDRSQIIKRPLQSSKLPPTHSWIKYSMIQTRSTPFACGCPSKANLRSVCVRSKETGGWKLKEGRGGVGRGGEEREVCVNSGPEAYMRISTNENISGKEKQKKRQGTGKAGQRAPRRSVEGYSGLDWSESSEEDLSARVTKISTQEMPRCLVPQFPSRVMEHSTEKSSRRGRTSW